ncbi:MAG: hypothetical protein GX639_20420, partial [Fibrobacter sp.]|nr:hypothetical protein [Fibrobacter sp.]
MKKSNIIPEYRRIFPEETINGNISIENNKILCTGNNDIYKCEIDIIDIQYIYLKVTSEKRSFLYVFDDKENWLPSNYTGFSKVYNELSEKFGFNDKAFFTYTTKNIPVQMQLWRKIHDPSYRILDGYYHDYESGFEIQSPEKEFVSWDTAIENLRLNPNVFFEGLSNDHQSIKFNFPVRIGNILLINFNSSFYNGRIDAPPLSFYAECFNKSNSDKSYNELKKRLKKDFPQKNQTMLYERSDQKNYCFVINSMQFSICYTYDSEFFFDGGYTIFSVKNEREYPELLINA